MVYDGENLKDTDPRAKSYQEYRDYAGVDEGMSGISTRFAYKIISKVFNFDSQELAANPVHLMYVLEQQIEREQFPARGRAEVRRLHQGAAGSRVMPSSSARKSRPPTWRATASTARTSSTATSPTPTTGSRIRSIRDTDTGEVFDRAALNAELEKIEKPAGIANPKDFRNEIVNFVPARPRQQPRQEPGVDQLRKAARGDREEDVLQHRRVAAGDQLQRQGERRRGQEARRLRQPHDRQGLHAASRCACCASGTFACARAADEQGRRQR